MKKLLIVGLDNNDQIRHKFHKNLDHKDKADIIKHLSKSYKPKKESKFTKKRELPQGLKTKKSILLLTSMGIAISLFFIGKDTLPLSIFLLFIWFMVVIRDTKKIKNNNNYQIEEWE